MGSGRIPEVDDYIAAAPAERQAALSALRDLIHKAVPDVHETMAYKMPTFETTDIVCSLASQKHYMSLYVCDIDLVENYKDAFAHLNCGKSCIRFKKIEELPLEPVAELLRESAKNPGFN